MAGWSETPWVIGSFYDAHARTAVWATPKLKTRGYSTLRVHRDMLIADSRQRATSAGAPD
jgi:hypothetical protein